MDQLTTTGEALLSGKPALDCLFWTSFNLIILLHFALLSLPLSVCQQREQKKQKGATVLIFVDSIVAYN